MIPVLTKSELEEFSLTQKEISKLQEKNSRVRSKMDEILCHLIKEWHDIEGTSIILHGETLWIDDIDYRGDEIDFESNWGKIYNITLDNLLDPQKFLDEFRKVKEDEEKQKVAKFIKRKQIQAEREEENEKLKLLGFDTENIEELKKQVLRLYNDKSA